MGDFYVPRKPIGEPYMYSTSSLLRDSDNGDDERWRVFGFVSIGGAQGHPRISLVCLSLATSAIAVTIQCHDVYL